MQGAASSHSLEILVVDDDFAARELISAAVRSLGYECREAADGEAAWTALQTKRADIVLSDWNMEGLDGLGLCKRLRAEEEVDGTAYTHFMFMTSYADKRHFLDGMHAGADDYLKKPIDLDELEARLESAARVVRLHRRESTRAEAYRRDSQHSFHLARTDALTGVPNRLRMQEELSAVHARSSRHGTPCAVAIIDIDHFKNYNDSFGHVAGDEALRRVTRAVGQHLRKSDGLFRYGGEEFLVLLPWQGVGEAHLVMDRVRRAVHDDLAKIQASMGITISIGVAALRMGDGIETWLDRADRALYRAKGAGRNRVEVASSEDDGPRRPAPSVEVDRG